MFTCVVLWVCRVPTVLELIQLHIGMFYFNPFSFIVIIVSSSKDSYLVSLIWNSSTFAWQRVKSLQYLVSAPFSSSKFSYWTLSMGTKLWLLCVNETQSGQTRWSQVLQNRHVIFFWCSSHLILSRITFGSTSWNGAFKSTIWCCELVCTLLWICFTFLTQNCITLNAPPF